MVPKREWVRRWVQPAGSSCRPRWILIATLQKGRSADMRSACCGRGFAPVPSGELLVGDPFGGLQNRGELPYFVTAPVGDYPLELSVAQTNDGRPVYAAAGCALTTAGRFRLSRR